MSTSVSPIHPVLFEAAAADRLRHEAASASACLVLADEQTAYHCYPLVKALLPAHELITVPAGEATKQMYICMGLWERLMALGADKQSILICLGGGMVCDLGGFVAALYKRGIEAIYMPTTLLAMTDAALGGKTGIDLQDSKNQLGLIKQPKAVLILSSFLGSLPRREWMSGWAEVWKHALLALPQEWQEMQSKGPGISMELLQKSIAVKMKLVEADPNEQGLRRRLNLGHTAGHALESMALSTGQSLLHGEAVAFGLLAEIAWASEAGICDPRLREEVLQYYCRHYQHSLPDVWDQDQFMHHLSQDKKNLNGKLRMSLPIEAGKLQDEVLVDPEPFAKHCHRLWQGFQPH